MKKLVSLMLVLVMMLSLVSVSLVNASAIEGIIPGENDFEDDCIMLYVNDKSFEVTLEKFAVFGVIEIDDHLSHIGVYILTLDKHDHDNTRNVAQALNSISEGRYVAELNYVVYPDVEPGDIPVVKIHDRFVEEYGEPEPMIYEELYFHNSDSNGNYDWALINVAKSVAVEPIENPTPKNYVIGDIVYSTVYIHEPFRVPYCVYDKKEDKFVEVSDEALEKYDGLREVFCTTKYGKLIGDVNEDGKITVMDATEIQRIKAQLSELKNFYVADFDRDKSVDVMDATKIQQKLAKIGE